MCRRTSSNGNLNRFLNFQFQPIMQALAVSYRQLKRPVIGGQHQNIPRGIQNGGANFAVREMPLDLLTYLRLDAAVNELRDVLPDVLAVQFHRSLPRKPLRSGTVVFK